MREKEEELWEVHGRGDEGECMGVKGSEGTIREMLKEWEDERRGEGGGVNE